MINISTIDTSQNFWELYPQTRNIVPFGVLYNDDKSKKKTDSSKIMWGLVLYCTNSKKSFLSNMTMLEREEELLQTFLDENLFSKVKELEQTFIEHSFSYEEKRYDFYKRILENREEFMSTLRYETHAAQLDDMLVKTKKIWDEFIKIKKDIEEAFDDGITQGNRVESLSERKII